MKKYTDTEYGKNISVGPFGINSEYSEPVSFAEFVLGLVLFAATLVAIVLSIFALCQPSLFFSNIGTLLLGAVDSQWYTLNEIIISLLLGIVAGITIGVIRLYYGKERVIEELVGAVVDQATLNAAKVSRCAALFSVAIGAGSGLAVGLMGIIGVETDAPTHVGMLLSTAGGVGGSSGEARVFALLAAIILVAILLTVVISIGTSAVCAVAGVGLVTGTAKGTGQALGIAIVLTLTRIRSTTLTDDADRCTPGKRSFEDACTEFIRNESEDEDRKIVQDYLTWLQDQGLATNISTIEQHIYAYEQRHKKAYRDLLERTQRVAKKPGGPEWDAQKPLRVARLAAHLGSPKKELSILNSFAFRVPWVMQASDPTHR